MRSIHVIHENPAWLPPLAAAFDRLRLPWTEWDLSGGVFDLSAPPPEGAFYNRMSASSHTRGHRYAAELTAGVLAWLTRHGRRVVNGPRALHSTDTELEVIDPQGNVVAAASGPKLQVARQVFEVIQQRLICE